MTKPHATKRQNGAIVALAAGLNITSGHCHKLIKSGMPADLEAARQWRENRASGDDSAAALRRERISLVREQKTKCRIDNEIRTRAVIPDREVQEGISRVLTGIKNEFLKFAEDMPPRLEGLDASAIQGVLRDAINSVLTRLSDATHKLF